MKKFILLIAIVLSLVGINNWINYQNKVTISTKQVYASNDENEKLTTSDRELALLASLVYEDVPNDYKYTSGAAGQGCLKKNGNFKEGTKCIFKALQQTAKIGSDKVYQYIEGLSNRKLRSLVGGITASIEEDGPIYYFLDAANVEELNEWEIVSYATKDGILKTENIEFDGVFDAITFKTIKEDDNGKKVDNYVIAFRGTDYPDLFEWIQDVGYAFTGEHIQARFAYNYAQKEYKRILQENHEGRDFNVYVTGHSLGAYLAQVGGAGIVNLGAETNNIKISGISDKDDYNQAIKGIVLEKDANGNVDYKKTFQKYNEHKPGTYDTSHLKAVKYFNGMGIVGLFGGDLAETMANSLYYLSTYNSNGNKATSGKLVNYASSDVYSSGRLALYSMENDPISMVGFHFGEIVKFDVSLDALDNHRGNHTLSNTAVNMVSGFDLSDISVEETVKKAKQDLENIIPEIKEKIKDIFDTTNTALDDIAKAIYTGDISKIMYDLVKINSVNESDTNKLYNRNLPAVVYNRLKLENGNKDIKEYDAFDLLNNLFKAIIDTEIKYAIKGTIYGAFDVFNVNHETDSFACIVDSTVNPDININVTYGNEVLKAEETNIYTNSIDKNYPIISVKTIGACPYEYVWKIEGNGVTKTFTTFDSNGKISDVFKKTNTLELSRKNLGSDFDKLFVKNKNNEIKIEVQIKYGNKLYDTKLQYNGIGLYGYKKTLLQDSELQKTEEKKINVVYDTTPPVCNKVSSNSNIKLDYTGSIIKNYCKESQSISIKCSDNLSGINKDAINVSDIKLSNVGLVDSVEKKSVTKTVNGNNLFLDINLLFKRVPTLLTPKLKYSSNVYDKAGNRAVSSDEIKFNITKGEKVKKCN